MQQANIIERYTVSDLHQQLVWLIWPGPVFYQWLSRYEANDRRCYKCNIISYRLIPCLVLDRKFEPIIILIKTLIWIYCMENTFHLTPERGGSYFIRVFFKLILGTDFLNTSCETEWQRTPLVMCQHWLRQWLAAIGQQTITWANVNPDLYHHLGAVSIYRCRLTSIGIPMLKIRQSHDRLSLT